ncbi:homoserine dehydrogenase [Alteribacter natronophilus]|uniref:homoserine dehydrogenase n=1 Tax=Alteribacter natronophilus TaxID=2583810 RepID=UPI00110E883B|nr:homoserine dehydrogenase [Alteribacter natronophilus]TMW71815.1 homoserine dehydrogenase [Alteribacter natronophilus]
MSRTEYKLGIIGFGTVGEGVYHSVQERAERLEELLGKRLTVPAVLVKDGEKSRSTGPETKVVTLLKDLLAEKPDAVVEATPDAETGYPYVRELLKMGITVVTANKELLAKKGEELEEIAGEHQAELLCEAAVAGGIPLLNTLRHTLKTNEILQVNGILNGTSNYVLTRMRTEGTTFGKALEEAQEKGYAEAVPDKDVDGWDASYKSTILSRWIFGQEPEWESAEPEGIRTVTAEDLSLAEHAGGRVKHVASLKNEQNRITAAVRPCFVFGDHPLYAVEDVNNGVHIEGSLAGDVLLQGPGAGKYPTASAVVEDVVNVLNGRHEKLVQNRLVNREKDEGGGADEEQFILLTGSEGLSRHLSVNGFSVTGKLHEPGWNREGVVVKAKPADITGFKKQYREAIGIYPVLADGKQVLHYFEQRKQTRAASF